MYRMYIPADNRIVHSMIVRVDERPHERAQGSAVPISSVPGLVQAAVAPVMPAPDPPHPGGVDTAVDDVCSTTPDDDDVGGAIADVDPGDDGAEDGVPVAAPRRSGRANQGVPGLRLGFEDEALFAAASIPAPQTRDGSDTEGMSEPFRSMWREAMEKELARMRERQAFTVVDESELPASARPIDFRHVYNDKTVDGGAFDRCKVRLVAQGFKLRYGIDYQETWAPTGRKMTLRALIAHAVAHKHDLC
jgi:hypothetical protein